jgi:hypothetical protein
MKNPWLKKNPLMSMWLSGANAMFGAARSRMTAEANRQMRAISRTAAQKTVEFWTGGMASGQRRRKRAR